MVRLDPSNKQGWQQRSRAMAAGLAQCHLQSNFLLKRKGMQGTSNTLRASSNRSLSSIANHRFGSLLAWDNYGSALSLREKGFWVGKLRLNHVREKGPGLVDFGGFSPSSTDRTIKGFPHRAMGLRKSQVYRGKASLSLGAAAGGKSSVDFEKLEEQKSILERWKPPRYVWRALAALVIAGQVVVRTFKGRIHLRNSLRQLDIVGPRSVGVCLLTAAFVGMAFTIQFVREFTRLGLNRSVGGVLALALSRELSPVVTAIIIAGRIGSAFAAELGTMQVSEQTDTLRVLGTDPVDYLVTPRVLACCAALPVLTLICFTGAMAGSVLLADGVYNVSANIILDSAKRALHPWDIISSMIKSTVFGGIISVISCAWGFTTLGGAKGVGESTTSAVVISLVCIFIADFVLSWCFFQGAGDALKAAMG